MHILTRKKKVNEQFKINRKSDMIYDWMINVIGKEKKHIYIYKYIGCTPNASVMNVWWHICHITSTTRYFSHSLTARSLARSRHQNSLPMSLLLSVHCMLRGVSMNRIDWNWFFRRGIQMSEYLFKQSQQRENVDGALKMCKYDWIVHQIACDVNDTVNDVAVVKRDLPTKSIGCFHVIFAAFAILSISQKLKV